MCTIHMHICCFKNYVSDNARFSSESNNKKIIYLMES